MATSSPEPGGFLHNPLPSPVLSTSTTLNSNLPHPRPHPLRAGSSKEEATRRYVEGRLLYISRRYTKKFQPPEPSDEVTGYRSICDVCKDLGEIVDVLWLSGTPSLQIPYLLNITLSFSTYLSAFPTDPIPSFGLLRKLDHTFASMLQGRDIDTGDPLPGFQGKKGGMSRTDMVRCKSLVEGMRVLVVEIMGRERELKDQNPAEMEINDQTGTDTDMDGEYEDTESAWEEDDDVGGYDMNVARVFEKTIGELGESLGWGSGYDAGS